MDLSGICTMYGNCATALPMSGHYDGFTNETSTRCLATSMTFWLLGYLKTSFFDAMWYRSQIFWQLGIAGEKIDIRGGVKQKKRIDDPHLLVLLECILPSPVPSTVQLLLAIYVSPWPWLLLSVAER